MSSTPPIRSHASTARVVGRVAREISRTLPALLIAGAGLVAVLDAATSHLGLLQPLPALLPIDPDLSEPVTAGIVGTGLVALAIGLARGKRVAWWVAIITLLAALLAQVELTQHLSGALLAAVSLGLLVIDRRRYRVETSARWGRIALVLWGVGAVLAIGALGAAVGQATRVIRPAGDLGEDAVVSWLAFGDPGFVIEHYVHGGLLLAVTLAARVAVVVGVIAALAPGDGPVRRDDGESHAETVARRFGQGALLPFQVGAETQRFSVPGIDAFLAYGRDGRVAIMLGDPIGAGEEPSTVLDAFLDACARSDWLPAVYQASSHGLRALRSLGFLAYRIGREAVVDLEEFDLGSPRCANLRHTISRSRRGGVSVAWYPDGPGRASSGLTVELTAADRAWNRSGKPQLHFTVSRFDQGAVMHNPLAVARDATGSVIAFATFRSTGCDGGWVLDLVRRTPGSVPGAVEACLLAAIEGFREKGSRFLSLGLAPLAGLDTRTGSPVERALAVGAGLMRREYDVAGLAFFKGKFDPRWETRYLAVARRSHLPAVLLALLRLHLGGSRALLRAGLQLRVAD